MTDIVPPRQQLFLPGLLMTLFLRLVALGCLWYAFILWGDLIGYGSHGARRFDLLATDLKAANATLAVLYPVAAVGLWLRGTWGPVIWTAASALEIATHQVWPEIFGRDDLKAVAIGVTALVYIALRLAILFRRPLVAPAEHG